MTEATPAFLRWSTKLKASPLPSHAKLLGDKIFLPPSALEQLLSASTVTLVSGEHPPTHHGSFNPFDPRTFHALPSQVLDRRQDLPHPLTFRLVNPVTGNAVYAGIREFSAEEGEIGLSGFVRHGLGLDAKISDSQDAETSIQDSIEDGARITVHAVQLPKGTSVRLRPLEPGYDPEDWKALLEKHLRNNFTTLTNSEIISIPNGNHEFRFLIDGVKPNGDAICIVDTDLEVDIEALNEEQARETLKRRLEKAKKAPRTDDGDSPGGVIALDTEVRGQVLAGSYVDYTLQKWDSSKDLNIELDADNQALDLFVSPFRTTQRARPREDEHVFGDVSDRPSKRLCLSRTDAELEGAEAIYISVHAYSGEDDTGKSVVRPCTYSLKITPTRFPEATTSSISSHNEVNDHLGDKQCKNCRQWIPAPTMMLHEAFCYRNNIACPKCGEVFKKTSEEWRSHWHCELDEEYGNSKQSQVKHERFRHEPVLCKSCGYHCKSLSDLAHHRTSTCPEKAILCQFCHLLVPQQGPDDPSSTDPEVILSGLTPHEFADGARTSECHLCGKIVRLRDMSVHMKHHDLERLSRPTPRICRNIICGRTMDGLSPDGQINRPQPSKNDLNLCDACFGPLYNSAYDPDHKQLKRRVERRYLSQLLTGCGKQWCRNDYCKTGRRSQGLLGPDQKISSKDATALLRPTVDGLLRLDTPLQFCTDENSHKRRILAEMVAAEGGGEGYDRAWCIAALEVENGDLEKARARLANWAPRRSEVR